jgi:tetratricopeptide (TPR) repeat protein
MLGENYLAKKEYASAIKHYSQVMAAKGNKKYLLPAYFKRALCYYYIANYTETLADLEAIAGINPGDDIKVEVLYLKGQTLFQMEKYTKAIDNYYQFLIMGPQDQRISEVLFNLGLAKKREGDILGAKDVWEEIITQERDSPQTYWASLQLGFIYYKDSAKEKAIAALTKAAEGPEPLLACEARYWLAELYFQAEDYAKGLQELGQIFKTKVEDISNPWLGMAYSKAGAIYEKVGDKEKARAAYSKVLQVSQDKELLTVASERIKALEAKTRYE